MKRIVNVAKNQNEARQWDIQQAIKMTPEQRQAVARTLRERAFGSDLPDVREYERHRNQVRKKTNS